MNFNYCQGYYALKYHMEEAYKEYDKQEIAVVNPEYAIFSKNYTETINKLDHNKIHDFCFIGSIKTNKRLWVIEFAKKYFTSNSVFVNTDITINDNYNELGDFDNTIKHIDKHYNPKTHIDNQSYDAQYRKIDENNFYFESMCKSKYCLCPEGNDAPWSFRLYEILMCKSLPIVNNHHHIYRTKSESYLKYKYILYDNTFDKKLSLITNKEYEANVNCNTDIFNKYHML